MEAQRLIQSQIIRKNQEHCRLVSELLLRPTSFTSPPPSSTTTASSNQSIATSDTTQAKRIYVAIIYHSDSTAKQSTPRWPFSKSGRSNSSEHALLILDKDNFQILHIHPITSTTNIKIVSESQFDLFFHNPPKMYTFSALDSSTMWTVVSTLCSAIDEAVSAKQQSSSNTFTWIQHYETLSKQGGDAFIETDSNGTEWENAPPTSGYTQHNVNVKEMWIREQLKAKKDEFTEVKDISVIVGTFNVNMKYPTSIPKSSSDSSTLIPSSVELGQWLELDKQEADIYVIGLQEIDMSAAAVLKEVTEAKATWDEIFVQTFSNTKEKYVKVLSRQLVGLYTVFIIKEKFILEKAVRDVRTSCEGVGVLGMLGNKGGVSVRFQLYSSTFCFINSHLAPHMNNVERRNQNFFDIIKRTTFGGDRKNYHPESHDYFFWLGDLNYRINMDYESAMKHISDNRWKDLLACDQLTIERKAKRCFIGFEEAPINFPCSYRFDVGTDSYDTSEKKRIPAYTDRILWKHNPRVKNTSYNSFNQYRFSDHKPVSASFRLPVQVMVREKYKKVYANLMKLLDKLENDMLPEINLSTIDFVFDDVRYGSPQTKTAVITNTGQVVCEFCFVPKHDGDQVCKEWIEFEPPAGIIIPGEEIEIQITVYIDNEAAHKLNAEDDLIDDILILHLKNGRDHFLSIRGNYLKSCFGNSLNRLVSLLHPVRGPAMTDVDMSTEQQKIPKELWRLTDYIHKHGMETNRIFKSEGSTEETEQVREILDTGASFDTYKGSMISVAEALLCFIESLEESVIPAKYFNRVISAAIEGLDQCVSLVEDIDEPAHYNVFHYLMAFARELLKYSEKNECEEEELAIILSRVMIRKPGGSKVSLSMPEQRARALFIKHFLNPEVEWGELCQLRNLSE